MNYRLQYVELDTGYTTIQIYPTINKCLDAVNELMFTSSNRYRITITTKSNQ